MLRRVVMYGVLGASALTTVRSLHANNYDVNSLGIIRLGRSAVTVVDVALTYQRELYYKEWDKDSAEYKKEISRVHKIAAEKLLELICLNKGVYIKVGQHIGALDYLLPEEFVQTMKVLHANAPQDPIEDLFGVIRQDLKINPEDIFDTFELQPLGTASLAQVHKGTLKTGEVVAIKVQHPYVKANARVDMNAMELAVKTLTFIFPDLKIQWLVDEIKKNFPIELDFINEGNNADKLRKQFAKYGWLKIPKIYWDYCSSRVLVMEFLEGGQITDLVYIRKNNIDPIAISNRIGQLYSEMIFNTGFVHSDPHPGNVLVRKNAGKNLEIVLLDHGLYANLTDKFRYDYSKLWLSILNVDRVGMRKYAGNLGIKDDFYELFVCMVTGRPWETLEKGVDKVKYTEEEKTSLQKTTPLLIPHINDILAQVDKQMILILKTNDLIRNIESTLRTQNRMTAFWVMSKYCLLSSFKEERSTATANYQRLGIFLREKWEIFKLNIYYLYLGLINFSLLEAVRELI